MSEWISVDERIPEPGKDGRLIDLGMHYKTKEPVYPGIIRVLAVRSGCEAQELAFSPESKKFWYRHGVADYSWSGDQDVTHWMPLPEPPIAR